MAFWGDEFIFDGVPCSAFGLMVYHFGSEEQDDVSFQNGEIVEDRIPGRHDALSYGLVQNQSLEYTLVFGANMESMDAYESIDRYEVETIAAWLTGYDQRKWLTIVQDDMESFRYKCYISELKLITYGDMPWAFSCKVSCDSPFAYSLPEEYVFDVNGENEFTLVNRSSMNRYYRPKLEIAIHEGDQVSIENLSDHGRALLFSTLPETGSLVIYVDNQNQIITNSADLNLYPCCNMRFLRLVRGDNRLRLKGKATIKFICEFPANIGG